MPHFARIGSAERAQQESERKEIGRQLTAAYYSCVRTSFASMLPTIVDRNSGISGFYGLPNRTIEASSI
jgi:hypothetical protein